MTFKERCDKIKKAAAQFWNENKSLIIAAGGFIAGTFITYKIMKSDGDVSNATYTPPAYIPVRPEPEPEPEANDNWDEETMRDNWDLVCELASNMEMGPDEEYHIYSSDFDVDGVRIGDNIVSHMVCGDELYPDDVEEYEELYDPNNEDEEEEDDDDENEDENEEENKIDEIRIKVPSNNKGLVELARQFSDFCNSGDIEIYSF